MLLQPHIQVGHQIEKEKDGKRQADQIWRDMESESEVVIQKENLLRN
jgi:hypothetical protein